MTDEHTRWAPTGATAGDSAVGDVKMVNLSQQVASVLSEEALTHKLLSHADDL